MSKRNLFIGTGVVGVIILAIVGVMLAGSMNSEQATAPAVERNEATTPMVGNAQTEPAAVPAGGEYVEYSEGEFANAGGQRILFFHASWCPQCRELDKSIVAGKVPDNVTIFKVDYDSNQALRKQYGVTLQTTVVLVDADGKEVKKFVPYDTPSLDAVVENLL